MIKGEKNMNKVEMISAVVEKLAESEVKVTKKAMTEYVDAIFNTITDMVATGEDVKITGFGTFTVTERAEREGRNPATGETITIPATKAPKFKASSVFKAAVKGE